MSKTILRWPAVTAKVGLCKVKVQAMVNSGEFPRQISLGDRAVGFIESEVDDWINSKIAKRDAETTVIQVIHTNEVAVKPEIEISGITAIADVSGARHE